MTDRRPVFALVLAAAFAVGGLVLPVAHDVAHAGERTDWVAQTHGDHHHHDDASTHGHEAQPACPDSGHLEMDCALCQAPVGADLSHGTVAAGGAPETTPLAHGHEAAHAGEAGTSVRGPPLA